MGMTLKIKILLLERNMTVKQLSEKLGTSGGNLGNKFRRDNFSYKELQEIAAALDCDFDGVFTMHDTGKTV